MQSWDSYNSTILATKDKDMIHDIRNLEVPVLINGQECQHRIGIPALMNIVLNKKVPAIQASRYVLGLKQYKLGLHDTNVIIDSLMNDFVVLEPSEVAMIIQGNGSYVSSKHNDSDAVKNSINAVIAYFNLQ